MTPASADQTSILFVPLPAPPACLTAVTSVRTVPGLAVRYGNKCPGAQDESPSPGASSGAEHTNPAAGGPCRPPRRHLEAQPVRPAPRRERLAEVPVRGPSAPRGPKGSLDAPGRVRTLGCAAARCPRRAPPGGRLGTSSALSLPRGRRQRCPSGCPRRTPPRGGGCPAAAGGPEGRGGAGRASAGPAGRGRRRPSHRAPQQPHLGAPGGHRDHRAHRRPGAPGTSGAARCQAPAPRTLPSGAESLGTRRVSAHWRGSAALEENGRMAALPSPEHVRMQKDTAA